MFPVQGSGVQSVVQAKGTKISHALWIGQNSKQENKLKGEVFVEGKIT